MDEIKTISQLTQGELVLFVVGVSFGLKPLGSLATFFLSLVRDIVLSRMAPANGATEQPTGKNSITGIRLDCKDCRSSISSEIGNENKATKEEIREEVRGLETRTREDISVVHKRIDDLKR